MAAGAVLAGEAAAIGERLIYATTLAAVRDADMAIEAVPEQVDLKRAVFAQLDAHLDSNSIIATNSSSIRVSLLPDATGRPERVANVHFYLPVWEHPMVEIGGGTRTSADTLDALTQFARRIGMLPLRVQKESTGFIFNRVWRAIKKEALKVVDSGVASHEDVDRAWMIAYGTQNLPPFALMDRIGLDVVQDVEEMRAGERRTMPTCRHQSDREVARGKPARSRVADSTFIPDPAYVAADFLSPDRPDQADRMEHGMNERWNCRDSKVHRQHCHNHQDPLSSSAPLRCLSGVLIHCAKSFRGYHQM